MGGGQRDAVKVVIINTQYVETDAMSFKSVVQSLTGKDSTVGAAGSSAAKEQPSPQSDAQISYNMPSVLSRGMSFKEFDRMFKEYTIDELYRLYPE